MSENKLPGKLKQAWHRIAGKPVEEVEASKHSRLGLWDSFYKDTDRNDMYDDPRTAEMAAAFLNAEDVKVIEDWGCGYGGFKTYNAPHQTYVGIDGSHSQFASKIVELDKYTTEVDAIHLRHVLEHNVEWKAILENALKSFQKRMVLTLFTPFKSKTQVIAEYPNFNNSGVTMVDVAFNRSELLSYFEGIGWTSEEDLKTESQYQVEHIFYLKR